MRRRRSPLSRLTRRERLESSEPLKGALWTRSERALKEPPVHLGWRGLAAAVAAAEAALLAWLWFGPALAITTVDITGTQHLTAAEVKHATGLDGGASVISVDGEAVHQRLLAQTWIRTATVDALLPGVVEIHVTEWEPVAVYHSSGSKHLFWISSRAVILGSAPNPAGLLVVQGPAGSDPRAGDRPLDPQLVTAMVNIQRDIPNLLGQQVAAFIFDSCGDLTLVSTRGWKVYFGRVLTPDQFASLRDKLAALKAIAGKGNVDYTSTDLEYVNVMNPSEPAVGYKPRPTPTPSPTPGATPAPSPSPSPSAAPLPACL